MIGVECIPACTEMWQPLLENFISYSKDNKIDQIVVLEYVFLLSYCLKHILLFENYQNFVLHLLNYIQNCSIFITFM